MVGLDLSKLFDNGRVSGIKSAEFRQGLGCLLMLVLFDQETRRLRQNKQTAVHVSDANSWDAVDWKMQSV